MTAHVLKSLQGSLKFGRSEVLCYNPEFNMNSCQVTSSATQYSIKVVLLFCVYFCGNSFVRMVNADSTANLPSENEISHIGDDCQVTPVIHVLQYPGCVPKPIPSFACVGRCSSYLQVSGSKIWQMERSCMCCQESGEREAAVSLFCPKAKHGDRKFKKVLTKAPLECMCRPCSSVEESGIVPQEIAGYSDEGPLNNHFRRTNFQ